MYYTDRQILKVLKEAKRRYANRPISGMCCSISVAFERLYRAYISYSDLPKIIEGFNFKYLGGEPYGYWWPTTDVDSRLKAFDKLINDYEKKVQNPFHNIKQYTRLLISKLNIFK